MTSEDVLGRYAAMLRDGNWSDLAQQQVMDALAAEVRELRRQRDDEWTRRLEWRGIDPGDQCQSCGGAGRRAYGNTATWRGGIGGAVITCDVCDRCWGSGSKTYRWPSHRSAMEAEHGE